MAALVLHQPNAQGNGPTGLPRGNLRGWVTEPNDLNAEIRVCSSAAPFTTYLIRKQVLLEAAPRLEHALRGNKLTLQFPPRLVHTFMVWLAHKTLLDPDRTIDAGPHLIVELPHDFVYDTLLDTDLADLYIFGRKNHIRQLRNDVITQLALQHYVEDSTVPESLITQLFTTLGGEINLYVEYAIDQLAYLSWNDQEMLPSNLEAFDSRLLAKLVRRSAEYAEAETSTRDMYKPAENVCWFHEHFEGELRRCHRRQRRLGLPEQPEE